MKKESIFTFEASESSLITELLDSWSGVVMQAAVYQESAPV